MAASVNVVTGGDARFFEFLRGGRVRPAEPNGRPAPDSPPLVRAVDRPEVGGGEVALPGHPQHHQGEHVLRVPAFSGFSKKLSGERIGAGCQNRSYPSRSAWARSAAEAGRESFSK